MVTRVAWVTSAVLYLSPQHVVSFTLSPTVWTGALIRSEAFHRAPTVLRSSVFPSDEEDGDAERRKRKEQRRQQRGDGAGDPVFDVPLANKGLKPEEPAVPFDRSDNGTRSSEFDGLLAEAQGQLMVQGSSRDESSSKQPPMNPFTAMVSRLSSTETIGRFMATAPPRVIDAMQTTVVGLMGNMGPFAVDSATVTTSENLANLMFQLQMTGYMFKNADYRLSLQQSLSGAVERINQLGPGRDNNGVAGLGPEDGGGAARAPEDASVSGKITVRTEGGVVVEVDAEAYMADLRSEVAKLRQDLVQFANRRDARDEAMAQDLIGYVNTLPRSEMAALTSNIQPEVLESMEALVYGILRQFGVSKGERILLDSSDSMTKLCLWQLVIGYNLRELEVREQFKRSFEASVEVDEDGQPLGDLAMGAIESGSSGTLRGGGEVREEEEKGEGTGRAPLGEAAGGGAGGTTGASRTDGDDDDAGSSGGEGSAREV